MSAAFPYQGTAVVTGAGSGIGRALAHGLAARRLSLALVDIREDRLEAVREEIAVHGTRVTTHVLDVADRSATDALPDAVASAHEASVSLLFNNAGVAVGGRFDQVPEDDFDWLLDINLHAPIRLTRGFLPHLRRAPRGRIVNISAIFGIIAPAGQTAYCTAKFGLRGFSEALRHELDGSNVGVTVVHPGGIATRIAEDARVASVMSEQAIEVAKARAQKSLVMPPERAAAHILRAAAAGRGRLLIGNDARVAALVQTLFPVRYYRVLQSRLAAADEGRQSPAESSPARSSM